MIGRAAAISVATVTVDAVVRGNDGIVVIIVTVIVVGGVESIVDPWR